MANYTALGTQEQLNGGRGRLPRAGETVWLILYSVTILYFVSVRVSMGQMWILVAAYIGEPCKIVFLVKHGAPDILCYRELCFPSFCALLVI